MGIVLKPYKVLRYGIITIHVQNNSKLDWPGIGLWFGILTTCGMSLNESGVLVKLILNMKSIALKRDFSGLGQN